MNSPSKRTAHQIVDQTGKPYVTTVTSNTWVGGETIFSHPSAGNKVAAYTTGKTYFADLITEFKAAKNEICIAGWQVSWDALLAPGVTLYSLLCEVVQANKSLKIYVMPWDDTEPIQTYDDQTKTVLESINARFKTNQIFVTLSPGYSDINKSFFSHHQKQVVVDRKIGFIGGIDLSYGRYDDETYDLQADAQGREALNRYNGCIAQVQAMDRDQWIDPDLFKGALDRVTMTASNERAKLEQGQVWQVKYEMAGGPGTLTNKNSLSANKEDPTTLDPKRQPRMPWQDVHARVEGPAVRDLLRNFVLRWNVQAGKSTRLPDVGPLAQFPNAGGMQVQVLRSASSNHLTQENKFAPADQKWKKVGTQDDIHRAMLQLIDKARRFIYIENQFFTSACGQTASTETLDLSPAAQFINTYDGQNQMTGAKVASVFNDDNRGRRMKTLSDSSTTSKPPTNRICAALIERIGRSIIDTAQPSFHVYITLPVHPEGTLSTASIVTQVYWTMQTLVFGSQSLLNGIRRYLKIRELMDLDLANGLTQCRDHYSVLSEENNTYESIPIEKCFEYVTLLNLRNWIQLGNRYETEQIYIHSKLMIVDDLYAIIGSANVNDRSMLGNRGDSELAILVADTATQRADINGAGSQREVRLFAHDLRRNVWKKIFGITGGVRPATELQQAIEQPGIPSSWRAIQKQAEANTQLYEAAFPWIPRNKIIDSKKAPQIAKIIPTWDNSLNETGGGLASSMPFQKEFWDKPRHNSKGVVDLENIKGFITALPIEWTKSENIHFSYPTDLVAKNTQTPPLESEAIALAKTSNDDVSKAAQLANPAGRTKEGSA
jgi:phospholipase D1/2